MRKKASNCNDKDVHGTKYVRGHLVYMRWENDLSDIWADTLEPVDDKRPCARCGQPPTKEGYDTCLGHIEGAEHACCGHGITDEGYIILKNGRKIRLIDED